MASKFSCIKNPGFYFLVIVIVAVFFYVINFNYFQVGIFVDDSAYMILAKSIATGQGYARINYPIPQPEVAWPIGFPTLLAPIIAIWPSNFVPLKFFSILLTVISIFILKQYLDFRLTSGYALLVVMLFAFNHFVVIYASTILSEPAYLFWSLLALYLFQRFEQNEFRRWYQIPLLAFVLIAVSVTRLIGGSLAIASVLILLYWRNFKSGILLGTLYGLGMLPQILLGRQAGGELFPPEVAAQVNVGTNFEKFFPNLQAYIFEHIPYVALSLFGDSTNRLADQYSLSGLVLLATLGLLALILVGFLYSMLKETQVGELYFLIYFAVIGIKTWDGIDDTTPRYLIPLLPLIYFYLVEGTRWVTTKLASQPLTRKFPIPVTIAIIIVPTLGASCLRNIYNALRPIPATDVSVGATWLAKHADLDAVVMTGSALPHYIYSHRLTTDLPTISTEQPDDNTWLSQINQYKEPYIIIAPRPTFHKKELDEDQALLFSGLQQHPNQFKVVYKNEPEQVWVFEVIDDDQSQ